MSKKLIIPRGKWSDAISINHNNWAAEYPYAPVVTLRAKHNRSTLSLEFNVQEEYTKAEVVMDNGEVWTDSCVEFFLSLDGGVHYYNFEFTCIGKMLLAYRKDKPNATHASQEILNTIKRTSSLGSECFIEKIEQKQWQLNVEIPCSALFKDDITSFNGIKALGNFYKCGDNLSKPHFLSWNKIEHSTPNFHLTEFFANIEFE